MPFIQQNRFRLSRLLAEQQHHAAAGRQPYPRIAIEAGSYLYDVVVIALQVAILDMHFPFLQQQLAHRRHNGLTRRKAPERLFNSRNQVQIWQNGLDLIECIDVHDGFNQM